MEALSPTMEEGQLVQWLKSEGDEVSNGDVLAEIETDKATMELVARGDGVLRKIFVEAGGTAPVGSVIAVIAGSDEDISGIEGHSGDGAAAPEPEKEAPEPAKRAEQKPPAQPSAPTPPAQAAKGAAVGRRSAAEEKPAPSAPVGNGGRVKASPLARRLAEEMGVDITRVEGSGPGGRVVKRDIEAAKEAGVPAPSVAAWVPDEAEVRGRTHLADAQDHREASRAVDRPRADVLPHRRRRHGPRDGGAARASTRCSRRTA
jgi:pyruvate dehydrogenase E2 component (dihydrolipoamide acetyltransferase)